MQSGPREGVSWIADLRLRICICGRRRSVQKDGLSVAEYFSLVARRFEDDCAEVVKTVVAAHAAEASRAAAGALAGMTATGRSRTKNCVTLVLHTSL